MSNKHREKRNMNISLLTKLFKAKAILRRTIPPNARMQKGMKIPKSAVNKHNDTSTVTAEDMDMEGIPFCLSSKDRGVSSFF